MFKFKKITSYDIVVTSVLLALVFILQFVLGSIKVGVINLSFVLVPIVIGATAVGILEGTILGFAFGLITIIMGVTGIDAFTYILFSAHPILTILTCIIKGSMAGFVSGLVFNALKNKNELLSCYLASMVAPIINTGIFILGALLMSDIISTMAETSVIYFLVIVCAGLNFIFEFLINVLFAPLINRILKSIKKSVIREFNERYYKHDGRN